jgi:co-chaperonin GroES (HSP10)
MNLKPTKGFVIVKQPVFETELPSGIVLPDQGLHHDRGAVIAAGDGSELSVGDFVLFPPFIGQTTEFEGEKLRVIKESDILGVFDAN